MESLLNFRHRCLTLFTLIPLMKLSSIIAVSVRIAPIFVEKTKEVVALISENYFVPSNFNDTMMAYTTNLPFILELAIAFFVGGCSLVNGFKLMGGREMWMTAADKHLDMYILFSFMGVTSLGIQVAIYEGSTSRLLLPMYAFLSIYFEAKTYQALKQLVKIARYQEPPLDDEDAFKVDIIEPENDSIDDFDYYDDEYSDSDCPGNETGRELSNGCLKDFFYG